MRSKQKKAVLFVPFWRMAGHVGNNRVERFVRWLAEDGYTVVMIRAGHKEAERIEPWGREITVVDRLGLHPESQPGQATTVSPRKPNKLRRALAYWVFNPDPTVVWAKAAARHPAVRQAMEGAAFILSSSPPESAHVGAWMLSRRTGVPHIMDMRDGWLDEPLKPLLHTSALRRWQERRLESRIARDAKVIQVTSDVWKDLFDIRYPELAHKVHVLTNGYPQCLPVENQRRRKDLNDEYVLIHAGRFMGSHLARSPDLLLNPLLANLSRQPCRGIVKIYGGLSVDEAESIEAFQTRFNSIGWRIELFGAVPRMKILEIMQQADGLLLLSASQAALPSKVFEYIATGLPIYFVADKSNATARLMIELKQARDLTNDIFDGKRFLLSKDDFEINIPSKYSDMHLKKKFVSNIAGH